MRPWHLLALASAMLAVTLPLTAQPQTLPACEDSDCDAVIVPSDSPVHFLKRDADKMTGAFLFAGRFVFSGTYYYGYDEIEGDDSPSLFLKPDAASIAKLPHWRGMGRASFIYITNPKDFAAAALPADLVAKIAKGKLRSAHGHIAIVAEDYVVDGECDHAVYLAKFVAIYSAKTLLASKDYTASEC